MLLVGDQSARHFGIGFRRQYRLGPFANIASPDAADIERRTATVALQGGIALLSFEGFHTDGLLVFLLVERDIGNHLAFGSRHIFHIIIEMRDGDTAVLVDDFRQQVAKGIDGVGHRSAEVSRMQVAVRAGHFDFPIGQAAQSRGQRGQVGPQHTGV